MFGTKTEQEEARCLRMDQGILQQPCAETSFKRLTNHQTSFRHERYENSTEISKHAWKLKTFRISWCILRRASTYSSLSKRCNLCLTHKATLLNKRSKLISKCRHQNKFFVKLRKRCNLTMLLALNVCASVWWSHNSVKLRVTGISSYRLLYYYYNLLHLYECWALLDAVIIYILCIYVCI